MIERHHDYILQIPSIPAGGSIIGYPLITDLDAPFLLRGRGLHVAPPAATRTQSDLLSCRFRYQNAGRSYLSQIPIQTPVDFWNCFGQNGLYRPVRPQQPYPPGAAINVDFFNDSANTLTNLQIIFRGVKLYKEGSLATPTYPQKCTAIDFTYQTGKGTNQDGPLVLATTSELRQIPLSIQADADFVFRGGQAGLWTSSGDGGLYSPFGYTELYVQLKDAALKPYSNIPIHIDWLFGNAGGSNNPGNFTALGNATPGLIFPEIYVTKNSVLYFDLFRSDAAYTGVTDSLPVRIVMSWVGSKVYA